MRLKPYKIIGLVPATEMGYRRWLRFLADKRALVSLIAVSIIFITSLFANLLANDRPYFVSYKGNAYFPFLVEYPESEFNGFAGPTNYYDPFIAEEINDNGYMVWPVVPYHYRRVVKDAGAEFPSAPDATHWAATDDTGRDVGKLPPYNLSGAVLLRLLLRRLHDSRGTFRSRAHVSFTRC